MGLRPGPERRISAGLAEVPDVVDVVVVGLGITGAGVALDAVTRGLTVLAVDARDLAFGTSRWSSKLVHGGLRYLAQGRLAIAHESAVERGILMDVTAPHLVHPLPMLTPVNGEMTRTKAAATWAGLHAGDALRRTARTTARTLPRPRRLNATETLNLAPSLRADTLRGGLLAWDGQLEDDARLVVTVARTAASYGAHVRTRARVLSATGTGVHLRDEVTGALRAVRARAVVNATGVWAGDLDEQVRLRPSRGTHLVLRGSVLPHTRVAVMVPIPGTHARFAMVLPQPDGAIHVGLTDEPVTGPVPDVPVPSEGEIDFLLGVVASAFASPPTRDDVVGAYAGLRPLLEVAGTDATADLSRRHAILTSATGVATVVGGKLTTYRRMAQDTLDALVAAGRLQASPCRTATLPLLGAGSPDELRATDAPARLVRRFGTDARLVVSTAREVTGLGDDELLAPASDGVPVTLAELVFAVTHEGAHDVGDLLDRRTRVGLVTADRVVAEPLARRALELTAATRGTASRQG
jgi:glycerol-3-phosphate dehydrogenase